MSYRIGDLLNSKFPHHESLKALWETKWRRPASFGVYPFMDSNHTEDFEPIFAKIGHMQPPYDFDAYAGAFFPTAESLTKQAEAAESSGELVKARELYLRAAVVYRIARFPVPRSPKQKQAWELNKEVYLRGARLLDPPISLVKVPHTHALSNTAEEGSHVPVFVSRPQNTNHQVPVLITFFGLDGYRTESGPQYAYATSRGWAYVGVEIPGTGDNPALKQDPRSPERCWSSLLDWLQAQAWADSRKVIVWGLSTGGYYAMRAAHTHADRLLGVVAQGGGSHHMFDAEWLSKVGDLEYPFEYVPQSNNLKLAILTDTASITHSAPNLDTRMWKK